ncbi:putative flavoprotein involved in K+ transport [Streptomyces zhaozhouensis]|uniref:Putative flavoprotein involved in K+ transport n=1 Tax=Streptomyces zhaozhouensis TaxID=1300267 RepID=A0A286E064_9ACTN|nr:NAD(P)-binding domain-containing protein [Streptomyces zhaozhouensis]SOD64287.1 putative flavoprotein involved in K+ transport [Streptomyces zhaozhouensis]
MTVEYTETVVVGAGQQGCGVAAALQELGRDALVIEKGEICQAWAHERWDSLRVGSGNRSVRFPGWEYDGDDPDGFMSGPELARHLRRYVERRRLRVWEHTPVREIECLGDGSGRDGVHDDARFRTRLAAGGVVESRNVVAAIGGYASPRTPAFAAEVGPTVHQVHAGSFRNARSLPAGAVLVVGAGISGQQIADELADAGREVYLSVGRHLSWPSGHRGRRIHDWMHTFSLLDDYVRPALDIGSGRSVLAGLPVTATRDWEGELNLGTLAGKGVVLVGSARGVRNDVLVLEDNVVALAELAARAYRRVVEKIDTGIRERGFPVPEVDRAPGVDMSRVADFGTRLDLARHGITTILWCTGFGPDYRILPGHVLDDTGAPIQRRGIFGALPGLYYAGLPDGDSLGPVAIGANVENGRTIAHNVHMDHLIRDGSPGRLVPPAAV